MLIANDLSTRANFRLSLYDIDGKRLSGGLVTIVKGAAPSIAWD